MAWALRAKQLLVQVKRKAWAGRMQGKKGLGHATNFLKRKESKFIRNDVNE